MTNEYPKYRNSAVFYTIITFLDQNLKVQLKRRYTWMKIFKIYTNCLRACKNKKPQKP